MGATRVITLPHGAFAAGRALRQAELRAPTGADEAWVLEEAFGSCRAELVSGLLERCVVRVEDGMTPGGAVRAFTAGDREALLLELYTTAFGDRLPCLLACPACAEELDLDLAARDLLVAPYEHPRERYEEALGANGSRRTVRFRLPTGADQEAASQERDVEDGVRVLVERCVERVTAKGKAARSVPEDLYPDLSAAMARLDPQAEISLSLRCPACGEECTALFDAATVLLGRLAASAAHLLQDVHAIALHYHWSERDILALDVDRRRRYLDLIAGVEPEAWPA